MIPSAVMEPAKDNRLTLGTESRYIFARTLDDLEGEEPAGRPSKTQGRTAEQELDSFNFADFYTAKFLARLSLQYHATFASSPVHFFVLRIAGNFGLHWPCGKSPAGCRRYDCMGGAIDQGVFRRREMPCATRM
jgi:hypothetical protein